MVAPSTPSAESRIAELMGRLLGAADNALAAGDLDTARATANDLRTVDPDNERAAEIIAKVATTHRKPVGERAQLTLLFSALVDSTELAQVREREAVRVIFDRYRREAHAAVERYGGQVVKYLGDGVLASFGYPQAHEDDARRAVLAALDLTEAIAAAQSELEAVHSVSPRIRVGIHTGQVVVADLGSGGAREPDSIVGAAPNLAVHIQSEAEPGTVAVSDVTRALVESDFDTVSRGLRSLQGVTRAVEMFEVIRPRSVDARLDTLKYRPASLVGRAAAIDRLTGAWNAVRTQEAGTEPGKALLVVGDGGIGKSRLAADLRRQVVRASGDTLVTACSADHANIPLWPITRLLERVLDLPVGDSPARLEALVEHVVALGMDEARVVPMLAPVVGVDHQARYPTPLLDPIAFRVESLACLTDWMARLAAIKPRLLLVEDVHWADPSTIELLGVIVAAPPHRMLTIMTSRTDHEIPWLDGAEEIALSRLSDEDAAKLVVDLAADHHIDDEIAASIVERGEGIPLFVEELTRFAVHAGDEPLPLQLQELFTGRLQAPEVDLRHVQVAATVGVTFSADSVAAVVGDVGASDQALGELAAAGIVEPEGDAGSGSYQFKHALMRDAAYETQLSDVRKQTHDRVAVALRDAGQDDALIAHHFDLAQNAPQAVAHYIAGAQQSQRVGAHAEATRLLTRAVDMVPQLPEGEGRDLTEMTALMLRVLSVTSTQGYAAPGLHDDQRRAEELAEQLGHHPEVSLSVMIAIWAYWLTNGDLATSGHLVGRMVRLARDEAPERFRPEVEACAGFQSFYEGDLYQARLHLDMAMDGFEARPEGQIASPLWPLPNDPFAITAIALSCIATLEGDSPDAALWEQAAIDRANECPFPQGPFSLAFVKTHAAWNRRVKGDRAAAQALGADVVMVGEQHGYAYWVALGSMYMVAAGDEDAPEALMRSIAALRVLGHEAFVASSLGYLAQLWDEVGEHEKAMSTIEDGLLVAEKTGERLHIPELLWIRAGMRGEREPVGAAADLSEALVLAARQGAHLVTLRVALTIARLPEEARPEAWRDDLATALRRMPPGAQHDEVSAAEALLRT